ncbi:MAG: type VII toxin-antitoxin system MntA family adenylyltransferase antitoxin [Bacillota bacterium]
MSADQGGLPPEKVAMAREFLCAKLTPKFIILFGSAATGKGFGPTSDVDLAFLSPVSPDGYELFLYAQELAEKLGREVDLVDLARASTVFRAEVLRTGRIIYVADPLYMKYWRMRALKDYALLNEERAPVLRRWILRHARRSGNQ